VDVDVAEDVYIWRSMCSEVTFYPFAQIEGSHDLIAYTAAIEHGIWHAGIRIRINMKRF